MIYNRLRQDIRAGHRRHHSASRSEQLGPAAEAVRARRPIALQHAGDRRACRRARSATPGSTRSGPPRGRRGPTTCSTWRSSAARGATLRATNAEFQRNVAEYEAERERRGGKAPDQLLRTPRRRPRLSGRPQPLAGDDERGLRRSSGLHWRYLRLPVPPERFAETTVRALPRLRLRGRERDRAPQGGRAASWRTSDRRGRRDRRGQHAELRGRANRGREHRRRPASSDALGEPLPAERARCWAPAGPAARRPGRCASTGSRWRSGTGRPIGRRHWPRTGRAARGAPRPAELHGERHVGGARAGAG